MFGAFSARPYSRDWVLTAAAAAAAAAAVGGRCDWRTPGQGLPLVHFSVQREHLLRDTTGGVSGAVIKNVSNWAEKLTSVLVSPCFWGVAAAAAVRALESYVYRYAMRELEVGEASVSELCCPLALVLADLDGKSWQILLATS
jgi:hypothetical protein